MLLPNWDQAPMRAARPRLLRAVCDNVFGPSSEADRRIASASLTRLEQNRCGRDGMPHTINGGGTELRLRVRSMP